MASGTGAPGGAERMRVAVGVGGELNDLELTLAAQMGCSGVIVSSPKLSPTLRWELEDVRALCRRVEGFGLRVEGIQNTRMELFDQIRLGLPGQDAQLEDYTATIRNIGAAGIPIFSYNWRPNRLYRTGDVTIRGGARATAFDLALVQDQGLSHGREYTADELWANFEYFVRRVMPVAEEAGVKLAHHPDDPPLPDGPHIGGVPRIFSSFEGFKRGMEIADSPNWGLTFCMGCWSEMGGNDYVLHGMRFFGQRDKIFFIHFRDVQGSGTRFNEVFLGDGQVDLTAALRTLKEVGFTGCLIDDHVPHMIGDDESGAGSAYWGVRGRTYSTGYIAGLLRAFHDLS